MKGKSAKRGMLSGYVPFLQISEERHKNMCGTRPKDARIKIFYQNRASRDRAHVELQECNRAMQKI